MKSEVAPLTSLRNVCLEIEEPVRHDYIHFTKLPLGKYTDDWI